MSSKGSSPTPTQPIRRTTPLCPPHPPAQILRVSCPHRFGGIPQGSTPEPDPGKTRFSRREEFLARFSVGARTSVHPPRPLPLLLILPRGQSEAIHWLFVNCSVSSPLDMHPQILRPAETLVEYDKWSAYGPRTLMEPPQPRPMFRCLEIRDASYIFYDAGYGRGAGSVSYF